MRTPLVLFVSVMSALTLSTVSRAADMHTQVIAATCMACHGPGGKSPNAIPSLAGLPQHDFVARMKAFQTGEREATIMQRHAQGYTDVELAALGAYFAGLK